MVSDEEITMIAASLATQGRTWKINGEVRFPGVAEIRRLIEDCIDAIRKSEESISIEIGGLLVKQTDKWIDIYVHIADLEYNE